MSTIDELARDGTLELFPIPDDVDRLPERPLWLARGLVDFIDNTLVYHAELAGGRTAYEHLEQFFTDFRCNKHIHADDLRRMMPTSKGAWKMHPPLLRVYGWVPKPQSFVAIHAELGDDTKDDSRLNDRCRDMVLKFIRDHRISEIVYGDFLSAFPKTP